jgi:hypothetical protein
MRIASEHKSYLPSDWIHRIRPIGSLNDGDGLPRNCFITWHNDTAASGLTLLRAGEISNDSVSGPIGWIDDGLPFCQSVCLLTGSDGTMISNVTSKTKPKPTAHEDEW